MPRHVAPGQMQQLTAEQKKKRRGALGRVFRYIGTRYWLHIIVVVICIFTAVLCNARGTAFMQNLIELCEQRTLTAFDGKEEVDGIGFFLFWLYGISLPYLVVSEE